MTSTRSGALNTLNVYLGIRYLRLRFYPQRKCDNCVLDTQIQKTYRLSSEPRMVLANTMSASETPRDSSTKRSGSRSRRPTSRPTTPLRPSSRSSLRESGKSSIGGPSNAPLESFEPSFAELSDSMADLEANFMHLQLMHESLARFSESFASFLYGLNMNAFCVDFPEVYYLKYTSNEGGLTMAPGSNSGIVSACSKSRTTRYVCCIVK